MKTILSLDEALLTDFDTIEAAIFDLNSVGIYDPNFIFLVKSHLNSLDAEDALSELMPQAAFRTTKVWIQ